jgi:hypothetical protein
MVLLIGLYFLGRLLVLLVNIRLRRKRLNVTKTLTNNYITELRPKEFIPYCYSHPILVCLLRLEPTKMKLYFKDSLLALLANIKRLACYNSDKLRL